MPRRWLLVVSLVLLCLGSSLTNLKNQYAQDDMAVIQKNPVVHTMAEPWKFFTESYWPKPFDPEMYRPLSTAGYAVQWMIGGGRPVAYRITSILLLITATLLVFHLTNLLLPTSAAWLAAAFFAVHPVHVESVAVGVNQSELIVGILATWLVIKYLAVRRAQRMTGADAFSLFAIYLTSMLFKESGIILIGLLVAAEITIVSDERPFWKRLGEIRPLLLVMVLGAVTFMLIRTFALKGNARGTYTSEALVGLSMGERALTMLQVVPHWFRLLLWPAHLQGDYAPREFEAATTWGIAQTQGLLILVLAVMIPWACRRRYPVVTFGFLWLAVTIFPVTNVLVPTAIMIAERTLFTPSIGMMIAVAGLAVPVIQWAAAKDRPVKLVLGAAVAAILLMGATRSASRQRVWQDQFTFWHQTTIDAPLSYKAHHALASLLFPVGARVWAEREYRRAIELYPHQWGTYFDLANKLRLNGLCEQAVANYREALRIEPQVESARTSVIACFLNMGRYADAAAEAREGMTYATRPARLKLFQRLFVIADSAKTAKAPAGTVRITVAPQDTLP